MPKIFEQDGFLFFFYMNEHEPVHVHVMRQGKKAAAIASENSGLIETKWHETFDK